jgi:glucose/arabinose dehydrogenase
MTGCGNGWVGMMRRLICTVAALMFGLAGLAQAQGFRVETIAEGLDNPWSIAFLPDGQALVTQKTGTLLRLDLADGSTHNITGIPDVLVSGQGGLMDVVLHPDFTTNRRVYLTWSRGTVRDNTLVLGRGRFQGDRLADFEEIFVAEPSRSTNVHYGARLTFLPDNTLLMAIGDAFDFREQAQRPQSHLGSIVHLQDDGTPVATVFEDGAPGVYSIGHRNPQAILRDPVTGIVYSNEHGPRGGDEINIIEPGKNYGWPITTHGSDYSGAIVTPYQTYAGMTEPLLHWTPSIAPAGMAIYRGEMFPDWDGDLLVAALIAGDAGTVSGHVRRVDMEDGVVVGQEILLGDLGQRIRDVRVAPDGSVYMLTDREDGRVLRLLR